MADFSDTRRPNIYAKNLEVEGLTQLKRTIDAIKMENIRLINT